MGNEKKISLGPTIAQQDRAMRNILARQEEEDWKTIAALLKAGCSMPERLQKKYDAHRRDQQDRMSGSLKRQMR